MQYRGLGMKFNLLFVLFTFLAHRFLPKYDVRMQLLMFQTKMLRDRIDDQRIVPTPEERAELLPAAGKRDPPRRHRGHAGGQAADLPALAEPESQDPQSETGRASRHRR